MDSALVTSLSGALAQAKQVDKISNNLANANTPGYKADELAFEETLSEIQRQDTRSDLPDRASTDRELLSRHGDEVRPMLYGNEFVRMRSGAIRMTDNPMDLAIEGNGFFEINTPEGVRLTRAGNFTLNLKGQLVNRDGNMVMAAGAAGQDPEKRAITLGTATINIDRDGNIYDVRQGQVNVGKISIVQVANPQALKKVGSNLFEAGPDAGVQPFGGAAGRNPAAAAGAGPQAEVLKENPLGSTAVAPVVHQGALEGSNVNPVKEMTRLIHAQRNFEQNIKLMESVGDLNSRISDVGKY